MLVNGTGAQIAPARHSYLTGAKPSQQCSQEIIAGAHLTGQFVGYFGAVDMRCIDFVSAAADHADAGAQLAKNLERSHHIADAGQVFNQTFISS